MRAGDDFERERGAGRGRGGGRFGRFGRGGRAGRRRDKAEIPGGGGPSVSRIQRQSIKEFIRSNTGVEAFVEPGSLTARLSVVFVAASGESRRIEIPDLAFVQKMSRKHGIPVYDAGRVGYPKRMKEYRRPGDAPPPQGEPPQRPE